MDPCQFLETFCPIQVHSSAQNRERTFRDVTSVGLFPLASSFQETAGITQLRFVQDRVHPTQLRGFSCSIFCPSHLNQDKSQLSAPAETGNYSHCYIGYFSTPLILFHFPVGEHPNIEQSPSFTPFLPTAKRSSFINCPFSMARFIIKTK